jgi:hypothetical protein
MLMTARNLIIAVVTFVVALFIVAMVVANLATSGDGRTDTRTEPVTIPGK